MKPCAPGPAILTARYAKVEALGFVAQWIERLSPEQKVEGSNPFKPTETVEFLDAGDRWRSHEP